MQADRPAAAFFPVHNPITVYNLDGVVRHIDCRRPVMDVIDYNGEGRWSRSEILARYEQYVAELRIDRRDLSPTEHSDKQGRRWDYPVMQKVIEGIEADDLACVRLGVEFIEQDGKFPFGKTLISNTARALRRASLSDEQKQRIRRRVFGMLRAGHIPHEYLEYAKLVRRIGFDINELRDVALANPYVVRFRSYFEMAARPQR
jgi:hypothetical protein